MPKLLAKSRSEANNTSRSYLWPFQVIFSMDQRKKTCSKFVYFPWWANGPCSPLVKQTQTKPNTNEACKIMQVNIGSGFVSLTYSLPHRRTLWGERKTSCLSPTGSLIRPGKHPPYFWIHCEKSAITQLLSTI